MEYTSLDLCLREASIIITIIIIFKDLIKCILIFERSLLQSLFHIYI